MLYINPRAEEKVISPNTTAGRFLPVPKDNPTVYMPMSVDEDDDLPLGSKKGTDDFLKDIDLESSKLSELQKGQLQKLLVDYSDIFATSMKDKKVTPVVTHRIDTKDAAPIKSKPYRVSPDKRKIIQEHVHQMLEDDLIKPAPDSPWASPVILVQKPDKSWRFVCDYRKLNAVSVQTNWPLPALQDLFHVFGEAKAKYFSACDLISGYWQVQLDESAQEKSSFVTPSGVFS